MTSTLLNLPRPQGLDITGQASPQGTMIPSNCSTTFEDGQAREHPNYNSVILQPETLGSHVDDLETPYAYQNNSYARDHSPVFSALHHSEHPCSSQSKRSSDSLASSTNTVLHLSSGTPSQPISTLQTIKGSFVELESGSSRLLADLSAQPSAPDIQDSKADASDSLHLSESQTPKIQFHQVVRISGGISSNRKRKKPTQLSPQNITIERPRRPSVDPQTPNISFPSPLRNSSPGNGSPNRSNQSDSSSPNFSAIRPTTRGDVRVFDDRESSSSPLGRPLPTHRRNSFRPGPPSGRSSFSHRSRNESLAQSSVNHRDASPLPYPTGLPLSFTRTTSMSSSMAGSSHLSTAMSRSSSPASSLYLPLRVPVARAPAPFFGPTPERVARVRERRLVAQRNAERAKGGWKAWWNNWYYQSDKVVTRKGKAKQDSTTSHHNHEGHSSHSLDCSDSDDGSCYHDVILEHERRKLERKLWKLQHPRPNLHETQTKSHQDQKKKKKKKKKKNPEKNLNQTSQSWLSWISNLIIRLPPPPVHPLRLPTPGIGILRPPTSTKSLALPCQPIITQVNEESHISHLQPTPSYFLTVQEVDSRTPLLSQTVETIGHYGDDSLLVRSQSSSPPPPPRSDPIQTQESTKMKTSTDVRFGLAPRRWFTAQWWIWKLRKIVQVCYLKIKNNFIDLFHIDWDSDGRYEGWENV